MGWSYPSSIQATCDRCGHSESIEGDCISSGNLIFTTPDEVGWATGDEGDLCPECAQADVDGWKPEGEEGAP